MDHAYRTRWSGQRCLNKLIIIRIVMYVLKQSRIMEVGNLKLIYLKYPVYTVQVTVWSRVEAGGHRHIREMYRNYTT